MVRLSKKVEYALIAVKFIASSKDKLVTAKEISQKLNISRELIAKLLQKLKAKKILDSSQGINGGYKLNMKPDKISLSDVIVAIEGEQAIVECLSSGEEIECCLFENCKIKGTINQIQMEFSKLLQSKTISDFV
jgi:Rrf2 family protein